MQYWVLTQLVAVAVYGAVFFGVLLCTNDLGMTDIDYTARNYVSGGVLLWFIRGSMVAPTKLVVKRMES